MITVEKKSDVVKKLQKHKTDTGSEAVQVGILSARIEEITAHLKNSPKDHMARRGLLQMVGKRRRLLRPSLAIKSR